MCEGTVVLATYVQNISGRFRFLNHAGPSPVALGIQRLVTAQSDEQMASLTTNWQEAQMRIL